MPQNKGNSWFPAIVGLFMAVGALYWGLSGLYVHWLQPKWELQASESWPAISCTVNAASVNRVAKPGSTPRFVPALTYEYRVDGNSYSSTRVWFGDHGTTNELTANAAVSPFLVDGDFQCYVDPNHPSSAVLLRKNNPIAGYWITICMVVTGLGFVMLLSHSINIFILFRRGLTGKMESAKDQERAMPNATCPIESGQPDEPLIVEASESRVAVAVGLWLFSVLWNGITWIVVLGIGKHDWGSTIFSSLFLAAGLALVLFALYSTLQIFNPKPILACSQRDLYPGSEFELSWMFRGSTSKIQHLKIVFEGIEDVTYRQGTNTRTEMKPFFVQTIIDSPDKTKIVQGFELVSIPWSTMHSFKSNNNAFVWQIRVIGKIAFWPDIRERFEIILLAPRATSSQKTDVNG